MSEEQTPMQVTIDDLHKLELRMGKVLSAERVEGSEKLIRYDVDFGEVVGKRQILSGIAKWYTPEELVGKTLPFIVNLAPRKMMGLESQGMLLATNNADGAVLLEPIKDVEPGAVIM